MPILISNLRAPLSESEESVLHRAKKQLHISGAEVKSIRICKRSLDARHKDKPPYFVYSVKAELYQKEKEIAARLSDPFVSYKPQEPLDFPMGKTPIKAPIAVIGFGPAGIFAAHTLAKNGYPVMVFERGASLEERVGSVKRFWEEKKLDPNTNVQFGEGGAGTFSDGKLTTRISDSLCDYVLQILAEHGAPEEIRTAAKPHIGTDRLRLVIRSLRQEIEEKGGKVFFRRRFESVSHKNGSLCIRVDGEEIAVSAVVLALGHSARDTFAQLYADGLWMEPKSFSVGVRIEQLQSTIDRGLYGKWAEDPRLPKGEYQLSYREGKRCVYTFCMCPGGFVVPAASESSGVVTNGMSEHARDGKNANAALVVSVDPEDFGKNPLDGIAFQRKIEQAAFRMGGSDYTAPASTVEAYRKGKGGLVLARVEPSYACGVRSGDLDAIFPSFVGDMLKKGLDRFDRKLPGFSAGEGILTGPETRTSSPLRILRDEDSLESPNHPGVYPCGEGAGYAGGIMSAAVDGIRVAKKILSQFAPPFSE